MRDEATPAPLAASARWLTLASAAALAGLLVGLPAGLALVIRHRYLDAGLYATVATALAWRIDVWAAAAALAIGLWRAWGALHRRLSCGPRRWLERLAWGAVALAVLVALAAMAGLHHLAVMLAEPRAARAMLRSLGEDWPTVSLAVIVAAVGLAALVRRRFWQRSLALHARLPRPDLLALAGRRSVAGVTLGFLALVNLAAVGLGGYARYAVRDRPNIVIITVCSLRADHLGCYGYGRHTSPNIDRLAQQSVRFNRAIAQSSWTRPSVTSFLTSRYVESLGLDLARVDDRYTTLAEVLRDRGYATAAVTANINASPAVGVAQGFDRFDVSPCDLNVSGEATAAAARAQLLRLKNRPFFLFVLFMDPHLPYEPHAGFEFPADAQEDPLLVPDPTAVASDTADPELIRTTQAAYDGEIAFTDRYVGRVLEALREQGLDDRTLIVFCGDHGEAVGDHGTFGHSTTLYQELVRVPLLIRLPQAPPPQVEDRVFPMIDLAPSLLAYIGVDTARCGFEGQARSLAAADRRAAGLAFSATFCPAEANLRAVQDNRYKLILDVTSGGREFYDLGTDPQERNCLPEAGQPDRQRLQAELWQHAERTARSADGTAQVTPEAAFTDDERRKLRALGYAH